VGGAVGPGDARPVEDDGDRLPVQRDVHEQLVEGPVEEGRVDRHHGVQPGHGETGCGGQRVLLGDAHVERALREPLGERGQPGRVQHRRGDRDDVRALGADAHHLLGEGIGPVGTRGRRGQPAVGVEDTGGVPGVDLVGLGRRVAEALGRDGVHDHGAAEGPRPAQGGLHHLDVVPVDRAEVLQPEVLEHALRRQDVLEALLDRVQRVVQGRTDHRGPVQGLADLQQGLLVTRPQPQRRQRVGDATDRGRVRAAVVVHHDDHRAVLGRGDVVQRLPCHAAGERTVSDDGDDRPGVAPDGEGLGQPVGVGQRGGGVAVLDPVVLALAARRVPRQSTALAQPLEALDPAGEHLVHVCLVAGVEHDRLARGLEHPVQRDGQLDAPQVGSEVPAGPRHARDQGVPDLGGQRGQLFGPQGSQISGVGERSQQ
jgi:hypothetical protein